MRLFESLLQTSKWMIYIKYEAEETKFFTRPGYYASLPVPDSYGVVHLHCRNFVRWGESFDWLVLKNVS